jgi:hypothetical protein
VNAGFESLHRVLLILMRTSWTCKVENSINFNVKRKSYVMTNELKPGFIEKM